MSCCGENKNKIRQLHTKKRTLRENTYVCVGRVFGGDRNNTRSLGTRERSGNNGKPEDGGDRNTQTAEYRRVVIKNANNRRTTE